MKTTDDQLLCRDLQHAWVDYTVETTPRGYFRRLRCSRCSTMKGQRLNKEGYILSSTMTYPKGYLRVGKGRMTREDRAELRVGNLR